MTVAFLHWFNRLLSSAFSRDRACSLSAECAINHRGKAPHSTTKSDRPAIGATTHTALFSSHPATVAVAAFFAPSCHTRGCNRFLLPAHSRCDAPLPSRTRRPTALAEATRGALAAASRVARHTIAAAANPRLAAEFFRARLATSTAVKLIGLRVDAAPALAADPLGTACGRAIARARRHSLRVGATDLSARALDTVAQTQTCCGSAPGLSGITTAPGVVTGAATSWLDDHLASERAPGKVAAVGARATVLNARQFETSAAAEHATSATRATVLSAARALHCRGPTEVALTTACRTGRGSERDRPATGSEATLCV